MFNVVKRGLNTNVAGSVIFPMLAALLILAVVTTTASAGTLIWTTNSPIDSFIATAISPNFATDRTVMAGGGNGLWQSVDGGLTWTSMGFAGQYVTAIAYSPNYVNDKTVFIGTSTNGIYKSTNQGLSWLPVNSGLGSLAIRTIALSPNFAVDQTIFAATVTSGIYKSTDGGNTWTKSSNGLTAWFVLNLAISPNYSADGTIYAGSWFMGLFKSVDGGANWQLILPGGAITAIALSPNYATDNTVFIGRSASHSLRLMKSQDGGTSWSDAGAGLPVYNIRAISISPDYQNDQTLFAALYGGGVYTSDDGSASWTAMNNGLTNLYVQAFAQDLSSGTRSLFAATKGGVFDYSSGDTSAPSVFNLQPADGGYTTTSKPLISAAYSDVGSGIDTTTVNLVVDGKNVTAKAVVTTTGVAYKSKKLKQGSHSVQLTVADKWGNSTTVNWTFIVDSKRPKIKNLRPRPGSKTKKRRPLISASYKDKGSGINLATVKIFVDGVDVTAQANISNKKVTYQSPTKMKKGKHKVVVTVADLAGNSQTATWSFKIK